MHTYITAAPAGFGMPVMAVVILDQEDMTALGEGKNRTINVGRAVLDTYLEHGEPPPPLETIEVVIQMRKP